MQALKERKLSWLVYIFPMCVLIALALYVGNNIEKFDELFQLSPLALGQLILLISLFLTLNGILGTLLYRASGVSIGFLEGIGLGVMSSLANLLPFAGGIVSRAVYLRWRHGLTYGSFLGVTTALYIIFFTVNGVLALTSLIILIRLNSYEARSLWLLFSLFTAMAMSILVIFFPLEKILPKQWKKFGKQLLGGWMVLRQQPKVTLLIVGVQIVGVFLYAGRYWISFHALSQDVSYIQCLLFSSATVLTQLVSIAPGGLGVQEGIVAGVATVLGFDPGVSAVAVSLDRLVATTMVVFSGTLSTYLLGKDIVKDIES